MVKLKGKVVIIRTHGKSTGEDDRGEDEDDQRGPLEHMHDLPDQALAPEPSQYGNEDQVESCRRNQRNIVIKQSVWRTWA